MLCLYLCYLRTYFFPDHAARRTSLRVAPLDPKKLSSLREQRLKEIKMFRIVQEIAFYLFYLLMLIIVASHNRDANSYRVKESLMNVISPKNNISKVWLVFLTFLCSTINSEKVWMKHSSILSTFNSNFLLLLLIL